MPTANRDSMAPFASNTSKTHDRPPRLRLLWAHISNAADSSRETTRDDIVGSFDISAQISGRYTCIQLSSGLLNSRIFSRMYPFRRSV